MINLTTSSFLPSINIFVSSILSSLFLATNAFGSLIGMVLAIWSNDPNFVYLYAAQAVAMIIMTTLFAWRFAKLDDFVE